MTSSLPLSGRGILVTREEKAAAGMADLIKQQGGFPHVIPLIAFRPFEDRNEHTYLERLTSYDWVIFTSKNGVHFFFEKLKEKNISLKDSKLKFAAVGKKTCLSLESYNIAVDFVPSSFTAVDFAEEFIQKDHLVSKVLISKGSLASNTISAYLVKRQIQCDEWITYETYFPKGNTDKLITLLQERGLDALTFTSPSTIKRFMAIISEHHLSASLKGLTVVCIGPVTKEAAEQHGLMVGVVPDKYTVEDMIENLGRYYMS